MRSLRQLALILTVLCAFTSCAADRQIRRDEPEDLRETEPPREREAPRHECRTGVPILMDIPVLGFFFSRRTVSR